MRDRLTAVRAVINDGAEALFGETLLACDLANLDHEVTEEALIVRRGLRDVCNGLLRDQK